MASEANALLENWYKNFYTKHTYTGLMGRFVIWHHKALENRR